MNRTTVQAQTDTFRCMAAMLERFMIVFQQFQIHGPIDINLVGPLASKVVELHYMPGKGKFALAQSMAESLQLAPEADERSELYVHHRWSGMQDGFKVNLAYLEAAPEPEPTDRSLPE